MKTKAFGIYLQLFCKGASDLLCQITDNLIKAVKKTPEDKGPVCSVPDTTYKKGYKKINLLPEG